MPGDEVFFGYDYTPALNRLKKQEKVIRAVDEAGVRVEKVQAAVAARQARIITNLARSAGGSLPPLMGPQSWQRGGGALTRTGPGQLDPLMAHQAAQAASRKSEWSKNISDVHGQTLPMQIAGGLASTAAALTTFRGAVTATGAALVANIASQSGKNYLAGAGNVGERVGSAELKAEQMRRHLGISPDVGMNMLTKSADERGVGGFMDTALGMTGGQRIKIPQQVLRAGVDAINAGENPALVSEWLRTGQWSLITRAASSKRTLNADLELTRRRGGNVALTDLQRSMSVDDRDRGAMAPAVAQAILQKAPTLSAIPVIGDAMFATAAYGVDGASAQGGAMLTPYGPGARDSGDRGRSPIRQPNVDLQSSGRGPVEVKIIGDASRRPNTRVGNTDNQ